MTNPPKFWGENDAVIAQNLKHCVKRRALSLGAYPIQMKWLASFTLEGNDGKWWDVIWLYDQKMNGTWTELETAFDQQYISDTKKDLKRQEFLNLEQGSMFVIEYEQWFFSLLAFVSHLHLTDDVMAKMFKG